MNNFTFKVNFLHKSSLIKNTEIKKFKNEEEIRSPKIKVKDIY